MQGAVCTGVWVIAHECGHQSFSRWQSVNDAVGLVMHTALLVPYYSWYASLCMLLTLNLLSSQSFHARVANILLDVAK